MVFDRHTLVIPEKTKFDQKRIITKGDVIIGDRCLVQFGIQTDGRIFVGEHAIIDGDLEATEDIRVDIFTRIRGSATSSGNIYLGEKVSIDGKLSVDGDLDVGDSVDIKEGFEAKGWINIRSPIPMVIYIFIYLTQLLKMGKSEEIERILEEMEEHQEGTIPISEIFLFIPNNAIIGVQKTKTDGDIRIGKQSTIIGNIMGKGSILISDETNLQGSIKVNGEIYLGKHINVHGSITSDNIIRVDENSTIFGDVKAKKIYLSKTAKTQGTLFAEQGTTFIEPYDFQSEENLRRFEEEFEIIETIENTME